MLSKKIRALDSILKEMNSFVLAFSGGVDSSFLAFEASRIRGIRFVAATIRTTYIPSREIQDAINFCQLYDIEHKIIDIEFPEAVQETPPERCYLCKRLLFKRIKDFANSNDYNYVIDGTNADDNGDFRPGIRALRELQVRSPLQEAGFVKSEIRSASKDAGLNTWDKPAYACLLTRLPYNTKVTEKDLRMIEEAEQFLFNKGFYGTRVRLHGDIARIECMPGYINRMANEPDRSSIIDYMKGIGFRFISLDLEGYKTGSMNHEHINNDKKGAGEDS
jgi:uncharacterized protein